MIQAGATKQIETSIADEKKNKMILTTVSKCEGGRAGDTRRRERVRKRPDKRADKRADKQAEIRLT